MDILSMVQAVPGIGPYLPYVLMVFGVCAVLAAQMPVPKTAGSIYGFVYSVVNLLGHNYRNARNISAPALGAPRAPLPAIAGLAALVGVMLVLSACGVNQTASTVDAAAAALTAAEDGIVAYANLPVCGAAGATAVCQNPTIKAKAQAADIAAYNAVKAAEAAVAANGTPDVVGMQAAVAALTGIVADLPK